MGWRVSAKEKMRLRSSEGNVLKSGELVCGFIWVLAVERVWGMVGSSRVVDEGSL